VSDDPETISYCWPNLFIRDYGFLLRRCSPIMSTISRSCLVSSSRWDRRFLRCTAQERKRRETVNVRWRWRWFALVASTLPRSGQQGAGLWSTLGRLWRGVRAVDLAVVTWKGDRRGRGCPGTGTGAGGDFLDRDGAGTRVYRWSPGVYEIIGLWSRACGRSFWGLVWGSSQDRLIRPVFRF